MKFFYFLFYLSGIAGLGYEILWTRMLAVGLGHEIISMLAVVSAFFSGIALGAWFFDRRVSMSAVPLGWYIGFELVIGAWAIVLVFLIPVVTPLVSVLMGTEPTPLQNWSITFLYPFFLLLPATAAMGGTLPAMDRFVGQLKQDRSVACLYSINTFGAMTGTLVVSFYILPAMGMTGTSLVLAAINALGAAGFLLVRIESRVPVRKVANDSVQSIDVRRLYMILFCTGLLGIGFEVVMVRILSQILENTVFSFAVLLTVYLMGTAVGAALYQRYNRKTSFDWTLVALLNCTAFFCLGSIFLLRFSWSFFTHVREILGVNYWGAIATEMTMALVVLFLPATAMGATFSHLAQHLRKTDGGVGRALCLNTLGGAGAPMLFGFWLIPALGMKSVLLLVAAGYILLIPRLYPRSLPVTAAMITAGLIVYHHPFGYRFVTLHEGDTVISHREGIMATVSILQDRRGEVHLKVNNHFQMGGTASVYSDLRQAHLPLLLHKQPQSALFLGLGTGITFSGAAYYPGLHADGVELIPEVIEAMPFFARANVNLSSAENLRIINGDARRYVSVTEKKYDVIIADLFHPARDGAASLYTVEHFAAVRELLNREGLFCQWLPLYQLDNDMLKVIIHSFLEVFPEVQAYLAHYSLQNPIIGLVGAREPLRYPEKWYRKKLENEEIRRKVLPLKYDSFYSLFGTFLAGTEQLRTFAIDSPLNTDDHPVVLFRAPRFVYGDPAPVQGRLLDLVEQLSPADPETILAPFITEEDYLARGRLSSYWAARDSFLRAGVDIERTSDVQKLYETAREPLLAVVRQSLDFSAAYFPLLSIAYELYPLDREASYRLLSELMRANPMRHEAYLLRRKLFDEQSARPAG